MKLAEALQERADLNRKIEQLKARLNNNCLVQEGETPAENPEELLDELNSSALRLEELMAKINLTNCTTKINGTSLTELIAKKDRLSLQLQAYREIINEFSRTAYRARGSEIKILPAVKVSELQKKSDELSKELRITDNILQENNWKTELI